MTALENQTTPSADIIYLNGKGTDRRTSDCAGRASDRARRVRIIDVTAPYAVAKIYLSGFVTPEGYQPLHYKRGSFYIWNGRTHLEIPDYALRSQLYQFLDQSFVKDKKGKLRKVNPNKYLVSSVIDGLRAAAY